jgi:hypothetical protein
VAGISVNILLIFSSPVFGGIIGGFGGLRCWFWGGPIFP